MLEGFENDWQEWTTSNIAHYTINAPGDYIFHVKATSNYSTMSATTSYKFNIGKPWYKTYWWYGIEIVALFAILMLSAYLNKSKNSRISKASGFVLILIIITIFEISSELVEDWINAQGVTIFAIKIIINISLAICINPIENWIRTKILKPMNKQMN